jgi:hypothetical protein
MHLKRNYSHQKNQNILTIMIKDNQTQEIKEVATEVTREVVDFIVEVMILMEVTRDAILHSTQVVNITKEMIVDTEQNSLFN